MKKINARLAVGFEERNPYNDDVLLLIVERKPPFGCGVLKKQIRIDSPEQLEKYNVVSKEELDEIRSGYRY